MADNHVESWATMVFWGFAASTVPALALVAGVAALDPCAGAGTLCSLTVGFFPTLLALATGVPALVLGAVIAFPEDRARLLGFGAVPIGLVLLLGLLVTFAAWGGFLAAASLVAVGYAYLAGAVLLMLADALPVVEQATAPAPARW